MNNNYFYPETNVHVNKADIRDKKELSTYTATHFGLATLKLMKNRLKVSSSRDLLRLHKILFDDVFYWAGNIRTINITKSLFFSENDTVQFSKHQDIAKEFDQIDSNYFSLNWDDFERDEFLENLTNLISDLWVIHPLVEGNTRTLIVYLDQFVESFGYKIDIDHFNIASEDIRSAFLWSYLGEFLHLKDILDKIVVKKD